MTVKRFQHVSVARPSGDEMHQQALQFYGELLGLEHIPKPATFTEIEVTWFQLGNIEIHVYATAPGEPRPHTGAHFCLVVDDLDATRELLEREGHTCLDITPIPNRPRFMTSDPFGNQIEVTMILGEYPRS